MITAAGHCEYCMTFEDWGLYRSLDKLCHKSLL